MLNTVPELCLLVYGVPFKGCVVAIFLVTVVFGRYRLAVLFIESFDPEDIIIV